MVTSGNNIYVCVSEEIMENDGEEWGTEMAFRSSVIHLTFSSTVMQWTMKHCIGASTSNIVSASLVERRTQ